MILAQAILTAVIALAVLWAILVAVLWIHRPSREIAGQTLRILPDVLGLIGRLASDSSTPRSAKLALVGLGLWIASPIDLIPDFIPVAGLLDDVVVVMLVLGWVGRRLGRAGLRSNWRGTDEGFEVLLALLRL